MRIFGGLLVTACLMGPVQALEFQNACKAGKQIVIGAVGDFLLHAAMQDKGYKSSGGYKALWPDVIPFMKAPHVMYGNLCLLYTSPSPRDKRQSRMPSSA